MIMIIMAHISDAQQQRDLINGLIIASIFLFIIAISSCFNIQQSQTQHDYLIEKFGDEGKEFVNKKWAAHLAEKEKKKQEKEAQVREDLVRRYNIKKQKEDEQAKLDNEKSANDKNYGKKGYDAEEIQEKKVN